MNWERILGIFDWAFRLYIIYMWSIWVMENIIK